MKKFLGPAALFVLSLGMASCIQPGGCRPVADRQAPVPASMPALAPAPAPASGPSPLPPAPAAGTSAEPGYLHAGGGAFY